MKIIILDRTKVKEYYYKELTRSNNKDTCYISIYDDMSKPAIPKHDYVLQLCFDDVTSRDEPELQKYKISYILFTEVMARQIKTFIEKISNTCKTLVINCHAGISRSGAVGIVLNDYFNKEHYKEDWTNFYFINSQICPNSLVESILRKIIFE